MAQHPSRTPNADDLTMDGQQSMLEGIFNEAVDYDCLRALILGTLTNDEFNAMRRTSRSMNIWLMTPANVPTTAPVRRPAVTATPAPTVAAPLRHQADLIDRCDESGMIFGSTGCQNASDGQIVVKACRGTFSPYHLGGRHLICQVCRDRNHYNQNILFQNIRMHDEWRRIIICAHISVCSLCNREQLARTGPEGFDGCVCYREVYQKTWLCHSKEAELRQQWFAQARTIQLARRSLRQVGNTMNISPMPFGSRDEPPMCPCGRKRVLPEPMPVIYVSGGLSHPFAGNQHVTRDTRMIGGVEFHTMRHTYQCALCCGYIVPADRYSNVGTRRSKRVRNQRLGQANDRSHTMLGSKVKATNGRVNKHGFEVGRS